MIFYLQCARGGGTVKAPWPSADVCFISGDRDEREEKPSLRRKIEEGNIAVKRKGGRGGGLMLGAWRYK